MRTFFTNVCCLVAISLACSPAQAQLGLGDSAGFDFETPAPVFGGGGVGTTAATNFNTFDTQATDGATVSETGFFNLTGTNVAGLGLEVTNNLGKDTGLTGVTSGATTTAPFNETSIYSDNYGGANVGNAARADAGNLTDDSNIILTFTGLDDGLLYDVTGGGTFNNNNFDTVWTSGSETATTDSISTTGGDFVTLSALATDGSGNLSVTVTRAAVQIFFSGVTIEATAVNDAGGGDPLKGDVDTNGVVDFLDIAPFIAVLGSGGFQAEADVTCNEEVDFLDVAPFIALLAAGAP